MHLDRVFDIDRPNEYKVHLASRNDLGIDPLDVFIRDRAEWQDWNRWRSSKDDFNRRYILSLIDYYPDPGHWLFGGIFEVLGSTGEARTHSYDIRLDDRNADLIGRLLVRFTRPGRVKSLKLENHLAGMGISELLREPYAGRPFPGYENVNHSFAELENVFRTQRPDWKAALQNVKGVYVIFDRSNGRKYVGSAYGGMGIWARWSTYMATGYGFNDELTRLLESAGLDYAREHFQLCLLEYRSAKTDDEVIIDRERFWKEALLSRGAFGYNLN